MTLPELSIRRHVLAYMLSGLLVLFGLISYSRIGVEQYPDVQFPFISITTIDAGANPTVVDASITNVIENQVNSIPGVEHIYAFSSPGASLINVQFVLDKNIDVAFNEVQSKIGQIMRRLPKGADPPVVSKMQTNSEPVMWLVLQGDRTTQQLNLYAENVLKKALETVPGVGEVQIGGKRERQIRVNLSPALMAAYRVTPQDIFQAFARQHLQLPGGFITGKDTEFQLKLDLEFHSVAALSRMIVAWRDGAPIRLADIGQVEDGLADKRELARFDGQPGVGLGLIKVTGANTVAIVDAVKHKLATQILPQLPPGMKLTIASNDADYIQELVATLQEHLLEGTLLTALVVWLFLRNLRSTLIVAAAIPVSLLGAIAAIYFFGYTFNSITLLALLLLIGVVVDDAIVVLENIVRHREHYAPNRIKAALEGSREVTFAVIAASVSLVSIFAPVFFMGGIVGQFFKSFAIVVVVGVLASLFVSLTLTPMLCSRYLKVRKHGDAPFARALGGAFAATDRRYRGLIALALGHRWKVVAITAAVVLSAGFFLAQVGKSFVPNEDQGAFLVSFKTPQGSSIDYTQNRLKLIEAVLARHPEIRSYFATVGHGNLAQVNQGTIYVRMQPKGRRSVGQQASMEALARELNRIPGVEAFPSQIGLAAGVRGEPLQFAVRGPNLDEVAKLARTLQARLAAAPGMGRVDTDAQFNLPELALHVDRNRAASLGLSAADVGEAVDLLGGGMTVARFNNLPGDGQRYDIRVKAAPGQITQPADLDKIYLRTPAGAMVPLGSIARFVQTTGPAVVARLDLRYAVNFYVAPTMPLGAAVQRTRELAKGLLPPGYNLLFTGQAAEFDKTVKYISFAFFLAMALLYMTLASQFNSFFQPLIIMLAQPLAVVGGVFALWLLGNVFGIASMTLNIYSMIGLVLLIGLVAKNSILLVDLTNLRRSQGMGVDTALLDACPTRMRPVLMTSFTIILAMLPAALGIGAGAETNGPLAVAVIGGMLSSTLLTLVVVPVVYSLAENALVRRRAALRRGA